ncbi:MAG: hypothetical protein ACYC96_08630 [Fimbriimonadaceae bacterium]
MQRPRGTWTNFDDDILVAEMRTIPQPDRGLLFFAMQRFARGDDAGFTLKKYGDDLLMLKKNGRSGRSLFFTYDESDETKLVLLLAYKKESDEVPESVLKSARHRRGHYVQRRRKE